MFLLLVWMKELVFASQNRHKIDEINQMLGGHYKVISAADCGITEEIPETGDTFAANALQKARYLYQKTGKNCFADDSGLQVDALNGAPGVYSARYAGEAKNDKANIDKLLNNLQGKTQRTARFKTVIALIMDGDEMLFEGTIEGQISTTITGDNGFGYDPIFIPEDYTQTFAQMSPEQKNSISHRARAIAKMKHFLDC